MRLVIITSLLLFFQVQIFTQNLDLEYYLGTDKYDSSIPSPESSLGFMPGEWHVNHTQLINYFKELAASSENAQLVEFGRTYENRPLVYLVVSSKENIKNLDQIKSEHKKLTDPNESKKLNIEKMPAVIYQGFSIHGNEPSGANATPLYAYHLLASKSKKVEQLLDDVIILIDPCFNPDGFNRFASWANSHKGMNLNGDGQSREYNEAWPRGRTNHYWFDLNRDWLPVQHPESKGRIANFHEWKPNVLTDHHEMGTNSTFFFQPGIPQRTNPNTPELNQILTEEIATYHASALDDIGSLYFSKEAFDDYYYGKGSTYPDINGAIGILFEQASSRGHFQQTENGPMPFSFTIKNQLTTAISTLEAASGLRQKLLAFQRDFYIEAARMGKADDHAGYVFTMDQDKQRAANFIEMLQRHQIDVYTINKDINTDKETFYQFDSYYIPFEQNQYRLIKAAFEYRTEFMDSIFYDVSAFNLAEAFGASFDLVSKKDSNCRADKIIDAQNELAIKSEDPEFSDYGYLIEWHQYFAPKALYQILDAGIRAKVANLEFSIDGKKTYPPGTIFIPSANQALDPDDLYTLLEKVTQSTNVQITEIYTGLTVNGPDLGSRNFSSLSTPKILILGGDGVSSYDAGELWHLLDYVYQIPSSLIAIDQLGRMDLDKYNTIIFPSGSYGGISKAGKSKLEDWASKDGHSIVAYGNALRWIASSGTGNLKFKSGGNDLTGPRPYSMVSQDRGSQVIGGAILQANADLSNPIFYGYNRSEISLFRKGNILLDTPSNMYACPAFYKSEALLSGYASKVNKEKLSSAPAIINTRYKNSPVICFADNPNFRAFWHNTQKLTANAIFFGAGLNRSTLE